MYEPSGSLPPAANVTQVHNCHLLYRLGHREEVAYGTDEPPQGQDVLQDKDLPKDVRCDTRGRPVQ